MRHETKIERCMVKDLLYRRILQQRDQSNRRNFRYADQYDAYIVCE